LGRCAAAEAASLRGRLAGVGGGEEPPVHGHALRLVGALPVQRLARAGAVVGGAADGAPPELVPPGLATPAPDVVYKAGERIHRRMADRRLLAIPA